MYMHTSACDTQAAQRGALDPQACDVVLRKQPGVSARTAGFLLPEPLLQPLPRLGPGGV